MNVRKPFASSNNQTQTFQNVITIDGHNHVGINNDLPIYQLDVGGDVRGYDIRSDKIVLQNDFFQNGSLYLKSDIAEISSAISGVNAGDLVIKTKNDGSIATTEKLRVNGDGGLGIGGANYGTVGSVLTSGGGSSMSWTPNYHLRVYCDTGYQPTDNTAYDMRHWVNDTDFGTTNYNSDFTGTGSTAGVWTCPVTGLYHVNLQAVTSAPGSSSDDGNLIKSHLYLNLDTGSGYSTIRRSINDFNRNVASDDDISVFTNIISSVIKMTAGHHLQAGIMLDQRTGSDSRYVSGGGASTFWEIYKLF